MSSFMALTLQTLSAAKPKQDSRRYFNPNPPGQIKDDSCTDRVLRFLRANRHRYLTHEQIVSGTSCKPKSVDWALYYLKGLKIIECRRCCSSRRSPLYQEYRAMPPIDELV